MGVTTSYLSALAGHVITGQREKYTNENTIQWEFMNNTQKWNAAFAALTWFQQKKKTFTEKGKKENNASAAFLTYITILICTQVHAPPFISPLLEHSTFRLHFSYVTIHSTIMDAQCTQCIFWSHIHSDNHCRSMAPIYRQFPGLSRKTLAQSWVRWMGGDVVQNRFHCVEEGGKTQQQDLEIAWKFWHWLRHQNNV